MVKELIFLCVLACIVGVFILILSIPLKVSIGYDDKIRLTVKYLFIKLNILPSGEKKAKKEKKPEKEKTEKKKTEKEKDDNKEKKPNPILEMVKANGHDGMMVVIKNLGRILSSYGGKLFKSIVFDEIVLHICVGTGDAASTAIKYGQTCQKVYPVFGYICSNNLVKRYDIDVQSDFLANKTESEFYCDLSICLRKIINASIAMVIRLIFGVVIKFIKGGKVKKTENSSENNNKIIREAMKG